MSLPPLGALAWPPRGNGARTGMETDDEGDVGTLGPPAPAPAAAPVAAAPPSMLTEPQKRAVREYLRLAMYGEFEYFLIRGGNSIDLYYHREYEQLDAYVKAHEKWDEADSIRKVDYNNSDAITIVDRTADPRVTKATRIIADNATEAVISWETDMYAKMEMRAVAARLDSVAQAAVQQVENYMQQDSTGFFDEAAEKRAVEEMADTLRLMLNPN